MRTILDAVAPVVGVVDAHPRLVILEVIPPLSVSGRPMEIWAAEKEVMKGKMKHVVVVVLTLCDDDDDDDVFGNCIPLRNSH